MKFLVNTPRATEFLTLTQTEAGRKAKLGDPEKFKGQGQTIRDAHDTLAKGVARLVALVNDATRTEVARHAAAQQLAETTAKQLTYARNQLAAKADDLKANGQALADARFELRVDRAAYDTKLIEWVQQQSKSEAGAAKIREAAMSDAQLAAVIYHAPGYLLGINEKSHEKLWLDSVEKHAPNAHAELDQSVELSRLLPRYDKAIADVYGSFANKEIAAKASTHVEVA